MEIKKLSKKILHYIIRKLKENFDDTKYNDESDVWEYSNVSSEIEELIRPIGIINYDWSELGFFWILYLRNKDKDISEDLYIPQEMNLKFDVDVNVTKFSTETYAHRFKTYSKNEQFNRSMIHSDYDFNYYDGDFIDDNTYDSESGDWEINRIEIYPLNESIRNRKIITEDKKRKLKILLQQKEHIEKEIQKLTT